RQLSSRENHPPQGQGTDPESSGAFMTRRSKHPSFIALFLFAFICLCISVPATAQPVYAENQIPARGVDIAYTVTIKNPASHLYDVEMSIKGIRDTSLSVSMPAWSPGIYRIENYARNVQDFRASNTRSQPLKWEQSDKQTWRIAKQAAEDVELRYQVFSTL